MGFGEVLREFGVKVTLGFDGKKVDQAQDKIEKFGAKLKGFALEASAVTAGLFAIQNGFTSNARSLENQAHLLGINTDALQQYEYAAKVVGDVNRDELVDSLQKLGDTMDKARAGNVEARQALEQLGGMSGKVGLIIGRLGDPTYKVTDAFHDMAGGIQAISKVSPLAASRIVEQTLGSTKLYNVLREGPKVLDNNLEAGKKNFALNEKMIHQGAEMDKQMSRLWLTFRKFGYEIGFNVMKHMAPMIVQFTKWFEVNKKTIASGINAFLDTLADLMKIIWQDAVALTKTLGPLVDAVGGTKNAVNLLVGAFIAYKALEIGSSFMMMTSSIVRAIPFITTLASSLFGAAKAFKAFAMIEGIADIVPALQLFGEGAVVALSPLLPILLALAAAGVALHEVMAVMKGEEGWGEKAMQLATTGHWNKPSDDGTRNPNAPSVMGNAKPMDNMNGIVAPGQGVTQENHFHTENNITLPHGSTAHDASRIISKANVDSHEKLMMKAKLDAARSKQY